MTWVMLSRIANAVAIAMLCGLGILGVCVVVFRIYFSALRRSQAHHTNVRKNNKTRKKKKIAFFHPFCSSGGGGERVLWKAIQALDELHAEGLEFEILVYTTDAASEKYTENLFHHIQSRFTIAPPKSLTPTFVHLDAYSHCFNKATRFSLIAEAWGTMRFAYMALLANTPDIFFDTTGCAFTYFVARILAGCHVVAYVHYPTISVDMLAMVWDRRPSYNNDTTVTNSPITTYVKLVYYFVFAGLYSLAGSMCCLVMVNSSWTRNHIASLWIGAKRRIHTVFPPCDTESLKDLSLERKSPIIVSIGQFRPEKDHILQIRSLEMLRTKYPKWTNAKLILIGSCRGDEDESRVRALQALVSSLGLVDSVEFVLNQPDSIKQKWFAQASVGLHTMWNEHFGIGVVEMMAAGLLVVAHNSGGPKQDIVVVTSNGKRTGFLATTVEEFANAMNDALSLNVDESRTTRELARQSTLRFSDETFNATFKTVMLQSGLLS
ncbi:ALG11 mannosyltransferase N-terminus [Fragilaria crotonensis]|nr:ALG11 mannosyltransferase N-terminus [Fragilaria crotonensis]